MLDMRPIILPMLTIKGVAYVLGGRGLTNRARPLVSYPFKQNFLKLFPKLPFLGTLNFYRLHNTLNIKSWGGFTLVVLIISCFRQFRMSLNSFLSVIKKGCLNFKFYGGKVKRTLIFESGEKCLA